MSLRYSYTLIAPFYDLFLRRLTGPARRKSLARLPQHPPLDVLLAGVGTGLDLPWLPPSHRYVGLDLTPRMLSRALPRAAGLDFLPAIGDAQALPFAALSFDAIVLHLILAVVPHPERCLAETARVLRPGGAVLVFDKFLRPGDTGGWKRLANPLSRHVATRLDVVFEDLLTSAPSLERTCDQPALAAGWFRLITLRKQAEAAQLR